MKKLNLKLITSIICVIILTLCLSACNNSTTQSTKSPACDTVTKAVQDSCSFPEMINFGEKQLSSIYNADISIIDEYSVLVCSSGATADEIAVIKVKGDDDATINANIETIKKVLKDRITNQTDGFTGYVEAEVPKLEKSVIKTYGKYVCLIISPDYSAATTALDNQFK